MRLFGWWLAAMLICGPVYAQQLSDQELSAAYCISNFQEAQTNFERIFQTLKAHSQHATPEGLKALEKANGGLQRRWADSIKHLQQYLMSKGVLPSDLHRTDGLVIAQQRGISDVQACSRCVSNMSPTALSSCMKLPNILGCEIGACPMCAKTMQCTNMEAELPF
jgi:hypothetical protein